MLELIAIIITVTYVTIACIRAGEIPESLSQTAYIWEEDCNHKTSHRGYIFTLYCFTIVSLLFYPWISVTPESYQFLCFLGCAGLLAVGVTPFFKHEYGYVHGIGCLISLLSLIIWMCLSHLWIALIIMIAVFIILISIKRSLWVFYGEMIGLLSLMVILMRVWC